MNILSLGVATETILVWLKSAERGESNEGFSFSVALL